MLSIGLAQKIKNAQADLKNVSPSPDLLANRIKLLTF